MFLPSIKKIALLLSTLCLFTLTSVHGAWASTTSTRLSGSDRYLTAVAVSQSGWPEGADTVILTTGENYPDALSAAPLAGKFNAPLLLVGPLGLSPETAVELKRLKAKKAYIVGGEGAISKDVEKQLTMMIGSSPTRLAGQDRYDTALAVANVVGTSQGIFVTSGLDFADALSIAPIAAEKGMPILPVPSDDLTANEKSFLAKVKATALKTVIVGGQTQIPVTVRNQFSSAESIDGADAYERNIKLIQYFEDTLNLDSVYVATGEDFPDALAASALARKEKNPLVLMKGNILPSVSRGYLSSKVISKIKVLGGYGVISWTTEDSLKTLPAQISSVKQLTVRIQEKQKYDLPKTMTVKTSRGEWEEVPVTWNLSTVSTQRAGTYYYEGTVSGYSGSVSLTLIIDPLPSKVDNLTAEVIQGDYYSLPNTVSVTMSDNSVRSFPVTWSANMGLLNKVGTYTFQGAVEGTSLKASLTLKVSEDAAISFKDSALEWVVRQEVGKQNSSQPIYKSDVLSLYTLDAEGHGITNLTGIEAFTNLRTLDLGYNSLTGANLTSLQKLSNLKSLNLENNSLDQITALKGLTSLTDLKIRNNVIQDFSPLKGLIRLDTLYLSGNVSSDYSPIRAIYNQLSGRDFDL